MKNNIVIIKYRTKVKFIGGRTMFYCEKCGSTDACERTDLVNEPVLCDKCYVEEIYQI